jgi:hypothetical protein
MSRKNKEAKKEYVPYQYPSRKLSDGGAIERAQRLRSQRLGGVHRELEGWPGSWDQQRRCLYPRYLRVTVNNPCHRGGGPRKNKLENQGARLTMAMRASRTSWFWRGQVRTLIGRGGHHE